MRAPAIQVQNLSKRFGEVVAVDRVSFDVERGGVTGLLGANGAGKTTTLAMLLGLLLPTGGTIRMLGEDIVRHRYRVLPRINFGSPYVDLPKRLTVREVLAVFARLYDVVEAKARVASLADDLTMGAFVDRPIGQLSSGQRTRVALAKALINEPELLLLDEPTASLDPDTADWMRRYLMDYAARTGATLLLASHNMIEVERMCGQVMIMKTGRIVDSGPPDRLIARYGRTNLEDVFLDIARAREKARV